MSEPTTMQTDADNALSAAGARPAPGERDKTPRGPMTHDLKTWPVPFEGVTCGAKGFELRKADRDFRLGDFLRLREYGVEGYTGAEVTVGPIEYIVAVGDWVDVPEPFVVLGFPQAALPGAAASGREDGLLAKLERAHKTVVDLCQGRACWTMSIPARPDVDPDLIIGGALREAIDFLSGARSAPRPGGEGDDTVERYRQALAWYADPEHWRKDDWGVPGVVNTPDYGDPGHTARAALASQEPTKQGEV